MTSLPPIRPASATVIPPPGFFPCVAMGLLLSLAEEGGGRCHAQNDRSGHLRTTARERSRNQDWAQCARSAERLHLEVDRLLADQAQDDCRGPHRAAQAQPAAHAP